MNFNEYCAGLQDPNPLMLKEGRVLIFSNRNGAEFIVDFEVAIRFLEFLRDHFDECRLAWADKSGERKPFTVYDEDGYRAIYKTAESDSRLNTISTLGGSQTNQLTRALSKLISYFGDLPYESVETNTHFDKDSVDRALNGLVSKDTSSTQPDRGLNLEARFRNWLRSKQLSEKTIDSYASTTVKYAEQLLRETGDVGAIGLYGISTSDKVSSHLELLEKNPDWVRKNETGNNMYRSGIRRYIEFLQVNKQFCVLPKPFLLLAGISGTGKSRFVRKQAEANSEPFELVAVRPDWHEPSDLLGYVSRINGEKYVVTPFLKFLVLAWEDAFASFENGVLQLKPEIKTFWLCLDEMNLAPVEQYFADYLSILETRSWNDGVYSSEALIRPSDLEEDARRSLRDELGLEESGALWQFFMKSGIQLAPNLVVAGTVNMDETTHGFSRKVIDRAYTIDFGEFFPNVFDEFFNQTTRPVKLSYSNISSVPQSGPSAAADPDGKKSIAFLSGVNKFLDGTPFQLAYRALNELLVTVACFAPADDRHLRAVWDDFLMAKLLPRIEGDAQKIGDSGNSLLNKLLNFLKEREFEGERPDLMRESSSGDTVLTPYRSTKKLAWMQKRLEANGFTSFWP